MRVATTLCGQVVFTEAADELVGGVTCRDGSVWNVTG
jgi:hypothetical protein